MNTEEVRREAMDIQETMGEQMTGCFASSKDHLYVKSSDGEPCDGETPVQGVEVRCYTAGAGNAREAFAAMGFKMVAVIDQTSSAGDWSYYVSSDGKSWYVASQTNCWPRGGFSYWIEADPRCIFEEPIPPKYWETHDIEGEETL